MPARRPWFALAAFATWWVITLVVAELKFVQMTISASRAAGPWGLGDAMLLLIWAGFTAGWVYALYLCLWMLFGKERIELTRSALSLQRGFFGRGRVRRYDVWKIRALRAEVQRWIPSQTRQCVVLGTCEGNIAFEYEGATVRFGGPLRLQFAEDVVDQMRAFAPLPLAADSG